MLWLRTDFDPLIAKCFIELRATVEEECKKLADG